jgi:hypothetical protein
MANGFAMRGFTEGLTSGLQSVNKLYDSYVDRDLRRAEAERLRAGQEAQNRWYEAQAKNQEFDNSIKSKELGMKERTFDLASQTDQIKLDAAKEEQRRSQLQAQFPDIQLRLKKMETQGADASDLEALQGFGLDVGLLGDANYTAQAREISERLKSGQLNPNDPQALKVLAPAYQQKLARNLGGVGKDEMSGKAFRVTGKQLAGFEQTPQGYVPLLTVEGVDADGQYAAYTAPYTANGSSDPMDPVTIMQQSDIARPLDAVGTLSRYVQNPNNREALEGYLRAKAFGPDKPISANEQDQIRSRQLGDEIKRLEYLSKSSQGKAKEEAERALTELRREKINTEQSLQEKNYADADGKGLGSVSKSGKAASFDRDRAMKRAGDIYRAPAKAADNLPDPPDIAKQRDESTARQFQYVDTVERLVTMHNLPQDQAELAARDGQPIGTPDKPVTTADGRAFIGWRAQIDGKTVNIPLQWVK